MERAGIKIRNTLPPQDIYDACVKQFGADFYKGVVFTVGDTIYALHPVSDDLFAHESTHVKQQAEVGWKLWWHRYLTDPAFRLEQEIEAYRNQWDWAVKNSPRPHRRLLKSHILRNISGKLYGNIISKEDAEKLIMQ